MKKKSEFYGSAGSAWPHASRTRRLFVELGIAAEDIVLVMRNSPLGRKIRGDPRTRRDMRMQTHQVRMAFSKTRHRFR